MIKANWKIVFCGAVSAFVLSCGDIPSEMVEVKIKIPAMKRSGLNALAAPSAVTGFDCYAVNVTASDISYKDWTTSSAVSFYPSGTQRFTQPSGSTDWPALTSTLVSSSGGTITMNVPAGTSRKFTMIGVQMNGGIACPVGKSLADMPNEVTTVQPNYYNLGSTTTDISGSATVVINNTYNAASPTLAFVSAGASSPATYVYFLENSVAKIARYTLSSTGTLGTYTVAINSGLGAGTVLMAASPGGRYLYVADQTANKIFTYQISLDGTLTAIGAGISFTSATQLGVSPDGNILYTFNSSGNLVALPIGTDGTPSATASATTTATIGGPTTANALKVSPNGKYLLALSGTNSAFTANLTSMVGAATLTTAGSSFYGASIDSTSTYFYIAWGTTANQIRSCTVSTASTGQLTCTDAGPFGASINVIEVDPSGNYLYVGTGTPAIIKYPVSGTTVNTGSGVTATGGAVTGVHNFLIDSTGKYLVTKQTSKFEVYDISVATPTYTGNATPANGIRNASPGSGYQALVTVY